MSIFGAAAGNASIMKLECPHCRHVAVYAREAPEVRHECKDCGMPFTREESEALAQQKR